MKEFVDYLHTINDLFQEDVDMLESIHDELDMLINKLLGKETAPFSVYGDIIKIVKAVHVVNLNIYKIDELELFEFMSPTFKGII